MIRRQDSVITLYYLLVSERAIHVDTGSLVSKAVCQVSASHAKLLYIIPCVIFLPLFLPLFLCALCPCTITHINFIGASKFLLSFLPSCILSFLPSPSFRPYQLHGGASKLFSSPGVYFNTLVPFEDRVIKYGVVATEKLVTDLLDWDSLYISGRLHKPVRLLVLPSNPDLIQAMQVCGARTEGGVIDVIAN